MTNGVIIACSRFSKSLWPKLLTVAKLADSTALKLYAYTVLFKMAAPIQFILYKQKKFFIFSVKCVVVWRNLYLNTSGHIMPYKNSSQTLYMDILKIYMPCNEKIFHNNGLRYFKQLTKNKKILLPNLRKGKILNVHFRLRNWIICN